MAPGLSDSIRKCALAASCCSNAFPSCNRDIQRDAAFVTVVRPPEERMVRVRLVVVKGGELAGWGATGRFDFNHVRAEVPENLTAKQARVR